LIWPRTSLLFCDVTAFHGEEDYSDRLGSHIRWLHFCEGTFIAWIVREQSFLKAETVLEEATNVSGIKSGITQKGIRIKIRFLDNREF